MTPAVVFDSSAIIAVLREEPGADIVIGYLGRGAISAVNLQELAKFLFLRGLTPEATHRLIAELRLDVKVHGEADALAAAELIHATGIFGSRLGDRSCMALAIGLGVPALTTDRKWKKVNLPGLTVQLIR